MSFRVKPDELKIPRRATAYATTALYFWAFFSLGYISDWHPLSVAMLPLSALAYWQRERFPMSKRNVAIGLSASIFLATLIYFHATGAGYLLGTGALSFVALAAGTLLTFTPLRSSVGTRLALPGLSGFLLATCTMTVHIAPAAVVAFVGTFLLALALRERLGLSLGFRLVPALVLLLGLTLSLAYTAKWSETRLVTLLNMFAVIPTTGMRFPPSTSLSSLQQWGNSNVVVLRVYGDISPPYLVGRSFVEYDNKSFWHWKPTKEGVSPTGEVRPSQTGGKPLHLYLNQPQTEPYTASSLLVEFPDGGAGFTLYTPRDFSALAAEPEQLHRYSDGLWQVRSRDSFSGFYYLYPYADGWVRQGPPEPLNQAETVRHLELPEGLSPEVSRLAQEVAGAYSTPEEKARRITTFFQTQFEYGYDYPFKSSETALEEFLLKRPPAHCEFFATAAALMLRSQGVPTRYINGFVVQERSFDNKYYVIRLKHAHAWVEAYLPDQGWTTLDPTPPGVLDSPQTANPSSLQGLLEWLSNTWRQILTWFRLSPLEMLESLKRGLASFDTKDWLALTGVLAAFWGLKSWWQRRGRRAPKKVAKQPFAAGRHDTLTPSWEMMQSLVQPLEWRRQSSETTAQWLERLHSSNLEPEVLELAQRCVQRYEAARYRTEQLDNHELASLQASLRELGCAFEGNSLEARERQRP